MNERTAPRPAAAPWDAPIVQPAETAVPARPRTWAALWTLAPLLSLGILSWAPFTYLALRRRRARDIVAALAYAMTTTVLFMAPPDDGDNTATALLPLLWIGSTAHTSVTTLLLARSTRKARRS
ncbi:hypothetical protein OG897_31425 [Streptomyces sp. NBC_00237]|uniref:hypothetical protein n=1 Tax=Streptomyces sp. NBC_00237 TaxID=2975687 RepID=UPI002253A9D2|nr:hypothetical protein [Streptomyces sp. NBC_00237]MCX5205926.1 hypothetical protein [Streptomyces sp. NBC_00237]